MDLHVEPGAGDGEARYGTGACEIMKRRFRLGETELAQCPRFSRAVTAD